MRTLYIILIWLLFLPFLVQAQEGPCFPQYMNSGKALFEAEKFLDAWEEFKFARDCPGVTVAQRKEAISWIDSSIKKNADLMQFLTNRAEYERDSAFVQVEQQRDRALALLHASGATQANERKELQDGLNLAYQALKNSTTSQPAFVLRVFGESVYLSHSRHFEKTNKEVLSSEFSSDGSHFLTRSRDSLVRIWQLNNDSEPVRIRHGDYIRSAIFSPNGTQVLTTSNDRTAQLWDLSGNRLSIMEGHQDDVLTSVFAPDGSAVLTTSRDNTAKMWNLSGNLIADFKGHLAPVHMAIFSPDGTKVLTRAADHSTKLWNKEGRQLANLLTDEAYLYDACFAPNGQTILTASANGTATLWDLTGTQLQTFQHPDAMIRSARFSPDGKLVLTLATDGVATLWDLNGSPKMTARHNGLVFWAGFAPNGQFILTASKDKTAKLWDLQGNLISTLEHLDAVRTARFNPTKSQLITVSNDHTARLWNFAGELLMVLNGHEQKINDVQFSEDGNQILTCSDDRAAILTPAPDVVFEKLNQDPPANLSDEKLKRYGIVE